MRAKLSALLLILLSSAHAQPIQPKPLNEAPAKSAQGLILNLSVGAQNDTRPARLISLHVPAGQPTSPFVAAGPFTARWEGDITSPLRAEYTFSARVQGSFKLSINGTQILEATSAQLQTVSGKSFQLNKGANPIVAEFTSDNKTDATIQLLWFAKEFPLEPVPPTVFTHNSSHLSLRENSRIREGRLLFAQLRCAACHADPNLLPARGEGMPELAQDAPVFDELGAKFNENWLAHWINDPHAIRPHALMPKLFTSPAGQVAQPAADLAAYLVSTGARDETAPAPESAPTGGALFANLGCVACHTTPDFNGKDEFARTPLAHLQAKWQPPALRKFLKEPSKNYQWSHMPNFRLSDQETDQLAAFLLSGQQRQFAPGPKGDPTRGAQLLVSSGCLNCHAGMPATTQPTLAKTLEGGWIKGCLAPDQTARGSAPDFNLSAEQRDALQAFAAKGFTSLKQDNPIEFAQRQMKTLRCTACHNRDGELSLWSNLEEEMAPLQAALPITEGEGAPIASTALPMSTWFGEKLQPAWMSSFIAGHEQPKPRPWLIARMPGFATYADGIAHGLSFEHGYPLKEIPEPKATEETIANGEKLLGENGGFNCTTCHGVAEKLPTAVFEAPGTNLGFTSERLRKDYFNRWVLHPLRIDPETKMPRFADDNGKTPLTDLYEGKASSQFDAIWQYLRTQNKK